MKSPKKRLTSFQFSLRVVLGCIMIGAFMLLSIVLSEELIYAKKVKIVIMLSLIILFTVIIALFLIFKHRGNGEKK